MKSSDRPQLANVASRGLPVEWWLSTPWATGLIVTDTNGRVFHSAPIFKRFRGQLLIDVMDRGNARYILKALNKKDED